MARQKRCLALLLILATQLANAAPALTMHVFAEAGNRANETIAQQDAGQGLKVHVFNQQRMTDKKLSVDTLAKNTQQPVSVSQQKLEVYFSSGYRLDELDWNIAGPNGSPNIISELTWRDIELMTLNVGVKRYSSENWMTGFEASYGYVFNGDNQDSDYSGNNRTQEFSRSNNNSDSGMAIDASVYAGYKLKLVEKNELALYLIPKVGFSYASQFMRIKGGNQTLSEPAPEFGITEDKLMPLGPFSGLDSKYDATWFGPWLGLESELELGRSLQVSLNLEYHYAYYDATADWNLRSDFQHPESYTQEAEGYGLVSNIEAKYLLSKKSSVLFSVDYEDWNADKGGEQNFKFANDSEVSSKLNEVNRRSKGVNIGFSYAF